MAAQEWVTVKTIWCDRVAGEAKLLEQRIYPAGRMSDVEPYHVKARECSLGLQCNMAGYKCRWSFLNPMYDPFGVED